MGSRRGVDSAHTEAPITHKSLTIPAYLDSVGAISDSSSKVCQREVWRGEGQAGHEKARAGWRTTAFPDLARCACPKPHWLGEFVFTFAVKPTTCNFRLLL